MGGYQVTLPTERREVTPSEIDTATEVKMKTSIAIPTSLASASIVDEPGSPFLKVRVVHSK
ncbi:MAG: hypothetical protein ACFFC7_04085 [Candidatus Hermodarchaeota archaeon]